MSSRRRRVEKILKRPRRMRFNEVAALLEDFGYVCRRSKGSHFIYGKAGTTPISVPKSGGQWVEERYLEQIVQLLKLDEIEDLDSLD